MTVANKTKLAKSKGTKTLLRKHRTRAERVMRSRVRKMN